MTGFFKAYPVLFWCFAFAVSIALHGVFFFVLLPSSLDNMDSRTPEMDVASVELALSSKAPSLEAAESRGETEAASETVEAAETVESDNRASPEKPCFETPQELIVREVVDGRGEMPAVYCPPPPALPPPSTKSGGERREGVEASQAKVDSMPELKKNIIAHYPEQCRKDGIEGVVELLLKIDASGRVASAEVFKSSGNAALDVSALRAYSKAVFRPAVRGGRPCEMEIYASVEFRIKNNARGKRSGGE